MTWQLIISGHTKAPEGASDWSAVEQRLHDELNDALVPILSKAEYGVGSARFAGNHVVSDTIHLPVDAPGVEHVHETTDEHPEAEGEAERHPQAATG